MIVECYQIFFDDFVVELQLGCCVHWMLADLAGLSIPSSQISTSSYVDCKQIRCEKGICLQARVFIGLLVSLPVGGFVGSLVRWFIGWLVG